MYIGNRQALLDAKMDLVSILKKHKLAVADNTNIVMDDTNDKLSYSWSILIYSIESDYFCNFLATL